MAWPGKIDKDELAKEMFGEDAAAVKAKLAKLEAMETTLNSSAATLTKQNELIENLSTKLDAMKVTSPYEQTPKSPEYTPPQYKAAWGEDADAAFQERFATASAPVIGTVLDTRAMMAKREAQETLTARYHDWHLFSDEINDLTKNSPLQSRVNVEFWTNAYYVVKGKHHEDIERDKNQKSGKFWSEPAGSAVTVRGDENKNPVDSLTDEEKKIANGLGVPLEIYAKNKVSLGAR